MAKLYLAGPMRGIPEFNFPAFHAAAKALRELGHEVFSPAEKDIERHGIDISKGNDAGDEDKLAREHGFSLRVALGEDLEWICKHADGVALLSGWEHSKGATAERATALALGLMVGEVEDFLQPVRFGNPLQRVVPRYEDLPGANGKPSNPKDALSIRKVPMSTIPAPVMLEVGLAMLEGALKYGRHNYRVIGVRASVYFDACLRHLLAWWEGEDLDPDSLLSHITKMLASGVVLRDAMVQGKMVDDRPPRTHDISHFMKHLNGQVVALLEKYPEPVAPYTEVSQQAGSALTAAGLLPERT